MIYKPIEKGYPQELPTKLANKACILVTFCLKIYRGLLLLQIIFVLSRITNGNIGSRFPSILMQYI